MRSSSSLGWFCGLALVALFACETEDPKNDDDDGGSSGGGVSNTVGAGGNANASSAASGGATSGTGGMVNPCSGGPMATPIPNCAPPPPPSTGSFEQDCVDRINQFRWECQCLPPLQRWNAIESCTDQQSSDDQQSGPHANFGACGENAQNTCPNWPSEQQIIAGCLQQMWDEGPGMPFSEHGHYLNMSSTSYTRVACGTSVNGQGIWSNQNFSP